MSEMEDMLKAELKTLRAFVENVTAQRNRLLATLLEFADPESGIYDSAVRDPHEFAQEYLEEILGTVVER